MRHLLLCIFLAGSKAPGQTITISWFAFTGGSAVSSAASLRMTSVLGQSFIGECHDGVEHVVGGFLADTALGGVTPVAPAPLPVPVEFVLAQNYPNPFNPTSTIGYTIPGEEHVSLRVYNVLGQEVATLIEEKQGRGTHSVQFNAGQLSSGVYFYRLVAGHFSDQRKMIILK